MELNHADEFLGFQVHDLSKRMRQRVNELDMEDGADYITASHGWIIGFLHKNRDKEIFQKDLESQMHMAKSSITTILQSMEKSGYITRVPVERDARLKKIVLTPEGEKFHEKTKEHIYACEEQARKGLTEEEVAEFIRLLSKMRSNFSAPKGDCRKD